MFMNKMSELKIRRLKGTIQNLINSTNKKVTGDYGYFMEDRIMGNE